MASPQDFAPFSLAEVLGTVASLRNAEQRGRFMDAQTEGQKTENKVKLHAVGAAMARALASRMNATRLQPGTPEFQATLEKFGAPMKAELQSMGFPVQDGPMDWNAIQSLAAMNPGKIHSAFDGKAQDNTTHKFYLDENGNPVDTNIEVRTPNLPPGMTLLPNASGPTAAVIPGISTGQTQIKRAEQYGKELGSVHKTVGPEGQERLISGDTLLGNNPIPVGPGVGRPVDPNKAAELPGSEIQDPASMLEFAKTLPDSHPDKRAIIKAAGDALVRKQGVLSEGPTPAAKKAAELKAEAENVGAVKKAEVEGKAAGEAAVDLPKAMQSGTYMLGVIDKALNHPGLSGSVGLGSLNPINKVPGTKGRDFAAVIDQLKSDAFLQAFQLLRGGGQITDIEGKKATDAIARLDTAQSEKEFRAALRELQGVVKKGLDVASQRASGGKPASNEPSLDDLLNKYK